jgi:hypothetical protein
MKYAYSLNARFPSTPSMKINCELPSKWPTKKRQRNKPVNDIHHFLAIDDFRIADLLMFDFYR